MESENVPLFGILLLLGQTLLSVRDVLFLNVRLAYRSAWITCGIIGQLFSSRRYRELGTDLRSLIRQLTY
jgi:hypothetical protein